MKYFVNIKSAFVTKRPPGFKCQGQLMYIILEIICPFVFENWATVCRKPHVLTFKWLSLANLLEGQCQTNDRLRDVNKMSSPNQGHNNRSNT